MAKRRELFYVIGSLQVGGAERHLLQALPALQKRGWKTTVYCLSRRDQQAALFTDQGVEVIAPPMERVKDRCNRFIKPLFYLLCLAKLWGCLARRRPAVVHFFLPEAYVCGAPIAFLAGCRRCVMSRRSLNHYQNTRPVLAHVERWLHPRMAATLGNSRQVVQNLLQEGATPDNTRVIYNGIEPDHYTPADTNTVRQDLGLSGDAFVMTMVANLIPYKGHFDLLEALGKIAGKLPPDWHLMLVGRDDGIGNRLKREAERLGIAGHVRLLGTRADIAEIYTASNLGILCSHEEGFSNSVLEGMASNLPMIVTDVGGNAEAVLHAHTGIVVPPKDPEQLAQAILELAGGPDKCRRYGAAARKRLEDNFSLDACVDGYEKLYHTLLT